MATSGNDVAKLITSSFTLSVSYQRLSKVLVDKVSSCKKSKVLKATLDLILAMSFTGFSRSMSFLNIIPQCLLWNIIRLDMI